MSGSVNSRWTKVFVNGVEASVRNKSFSHTVALDEGLNLICVEAQTRMMNRTIAMIFLPVYRMAGEMDIVIQKPEDGSYLSDNPVVVSGYIEGAVDLESVTVNGEESLIGGRSFSTGVIADKEDFTITVTAVDAYLGTVSKIITVHQDLTPPEISEVMPEDGFWSNSSVVSVSGTAEDVTTPEVYVNNHLAYSWDSYFQYDAQLEEGANTILISARDAAGNESSYPAFTINVDTTPPETLDVSIDVPEYPSETNNSRPILTFTGEDLGCGLNRYEISIDGKDFLEQISGFQTPILDDGEHIITVRVYDNLENYTDVSVRVAVDTTPPDTPSSFRAIPGNKNVILRWNEDDDETSSYSVSWIRETAILSEEIDRRMII